jgi:Tol biopolymer transport system component
MKRFALIILAVTLAAGVLGAQDLERLFKAAVNTETVDRNCKGALEQYRKVVAGSNRALAAQALLRMAGCHQQLGDDEAQKIYQRLVNDFSDQKEIFQLAQQRLAMRSGAGAAVRGDRVVWSGPKVDLFGRVSADDRFISFTDWSGFNNLSIYNLTTQTERPLTGNKGWFGEDPNWGEAQWSAISPDGRQAAYAWIRKEANEIRIIPTGTDAVRQPRTLMTFTDAAPGVRDWSPDGKLLAVTLERNDHTMQIATVAVDEGSLRVIKSNGWSGGGDMPLFFSRDGRYIAYDRAADDEPDAQQRDVFILAVDGSREVRAVEHRADDRAAGWSPDGRHLLFSSTRTGARSLWAVRVADGLPQGQPELIRTDIGSSISLGVSRSGTLYLHKYVSSRDVKIARIDLTTGTLIGRPTHFSQGLLPEPRMPQWSPDGEFLAYQVRGEEEGLAVRSVKTGEVRRIRNLQYVPNPRWSPDGRSLIANAGDSKGRIGIFQFDAQTGQTTLIVQTSGLGAAPRWSADGSKIYYVGRQPFMTGGRPVRERDLRSGIERDVFTHPLLRNFEVSPDGRQIALQTAIDPATQTASVILVPLNGGAPREIGRLPAAEVLTSPISWTPDSRSILMARKSGSRADLWLVDVESGKSRKCEIDVSEWTAGEGGPVFALSPDGQHIAFLMGKSAHEVWALENLLPAPAR